MKRLIGFGLFCVAIGLVVMMCLPGYFCRQFTRIIMSVCRVSIILLLNKKGRAVLVGMLSLFLYYLY